MYLVSCGLQIEMGKRVLIHAYLMEARRAVPSLVVFPEHRFPVTPVEGGACLHGSVDYIVAQPDPVGMWSGSISLGFLTVFFADHRLWLLLQRARVPRVS